MTDPADSVPIRTDDFMFFVRRAVEGMAAIVASLGDEDANRRPNLAGANSPYALLNHCLGVIEYWGGSLIAGRPSERDRPAEFDTSGPTPAIVDRSRLALDQLALDIAQMEPTAPLRFVPTPNSLGPDRPLNQGAALLHLYEEMAQHHGQMELLRDSIVHEVRSATNPAVPFDPPLTWLRKKQGLKWQRPGPDLLPAWVADMDFPVAPPIRTALLETIDRGDLGYPDWKDQPLAAAFCDRMDRRYSWKPAVDAVRTITDLIQALQVVIEIATEVGDPIIAQAPNYPPFLATIRRPGRKLVELPMTAVGATWTWDIERLDRDVEASGARLLLLVNPHNPTGHVSTQAELEALADVVVRRDMIVVSDEIHADLTFAPNSHIPFASLSPAVEARTITISSATKAFNIAGLRAAVAHIGPESIRARWDSHPPDLFGAVNVLGVNATLAAWKDGDAWLEQVMHHLAGQRNAITDALAPLERVAYQPPEASYLAWIDCRGLGLTVEPDDYFRRTAKVELSPGPDFGPSGVGWSRLNFATSRAVLDSILANMTEAISHS